MQIIHRLADIIAPYDLIICDIWGVLHNGIAGFDGAFQALKLVKEANKTVILLSNAPRPSYDVIAQLNSLGITQECYDAIVTSGDVTQSLLTQRGASPVYLLGPERDLPIFEGLEVKRVALDAAQYVVCTGLFNDVIETPDDYEPILRIMLAKKLPMICANPDLVVERGKQLIYCAGALADKYANMGGNVTLIGKPFPIVYEKVFEAYAKIHDQKPNKKRCLAIGDAIRTDIKGAVQFGIDSLFVASGIHAEDLMATNGLDNNKVDAFMKVQEFTPSFVSEQLA